MNAIRVLDVPDLGEEACLVDLVDGTLLLLDSGLSLGERMDVLNRVMAEESA